MKKYIPILMLFLPVFAGLQSCKKDEGPQPTEHEYYQPVRIGDYYRYSVDSVWYDYPNDSSGQVQYTIIESYDTDVPNSAGKLETRIKLERIDALPRRVIGFSYVQRYYNAAKQEYSIERVDNDVRYVLFRAPILVGDTFNRNSKNLLPADVWTNSSVGQPDGGAGGNYDYVFRLVKDEYEDSLTYIADYELYGFNTGLFYKERTYLAGRTDTLNWQNIPVTSRIEYGFSYKKVLVESGLIQ